MNKATEIMLDITIMLLFAGGMLATSEIRKVAIFGTVLMSVGALLLAWLKSRNDFDREDFWND